MGDYSKRKNNYAIVKRKVVQDYQINTVFGVGVKVKQCSHCKEWMPITNFYLKNSNDPYSVRSQCCRCWDKYNGKANEKYAKEKYKPSTTLQDFFDEETL